MNKYYNTNFSLLIFIFVYIFAFGAGEAVFFYLPKNIHPLLQLALAIITSALFVFCFSRFFKNSSLYDPFWSVAPMIYVFYFFQISNSDSNSFRQIIALIAIWLWGIRLTINWARSFKGLQHQDWRYTMLKTKQPKFAFLIDLFGIHLFPAMQIILCMLPLYPAISIGAKDTDGIDILAFTVALSGIVLSLIADEQLRLFKRKNPDPKANINTGLWDLCRHPNYLGETLFWLGIFFIGLNAVPEYWWTCAGVVSIYIMFRFVSIPMMEKHLLQYKDNYQSYKNETPPFLPIKFPKFD